MFRAELSSLFNLESKAKLRSLHFLGLWSCEKAVGPEEKDLIACVTSMSVGSCAFFIPISARSDNENTHKTPTETLVTQARSLARFTHSDGRIQFVWNARRLMLNTKWARGETPVCGNQNTSTVVAVVSFPPALTIALAMTPVQ